MSFSMTFNASSARPIHPSARAPIKVALAAFRFFQGGSSIVGTQNSTVRYFHTKQWETDMLKGGLLWLIGIPLPIILILFLIGWLH
jgi:hypothetical protein